MCCFLGAVFCKKTCSFDMPFWYELRKLHSFMTEMHNFLECLGDFAILFSCSGLKDFLELRFTVTMNTRLDNSPKINSTRHVTCKQSKQCGVR